MAQRLAKRNPGERGRGKETIVERQEGIVVLGKEKWEGKRLEVASKTGVLISFIETPN